MSFFQEYSLLFVVATPVAAIVAMNVALILSGERDTLLVPGLMTFPSSPIAEAAPEQAPQVAEPVIASEAANDDQDRLAA